MIADLSRPRSLGVAIFTGAVVVAASALAAPIEKAPLTPPTKAALPPTVVPATAMKSASPDKIGSFGLLSAKKPGLVAGAVPTPPKDQVPSRFESVAVVGALGCSENIRVAVKVRAGSAGGAHTLVVGVLRSASFGPSAVAAFEATVDVPSNEVREVVLETPLRPTCLSDGNLDPRVLVIQVGGSSRTQGPPGAFGAPTWTEVPMALQTLVPRTATMAVSTAPL